MPLLDTPLELPAELRPRLGKARRAVAFTGAGISKESGLDTFRDVGGVWQQVRPEDMATLDAFRRRPAVVWSWYAERWGRASAVAPNPAHFALARWEEIFPYFTLVTQNVDGLHPRAGSRRLIELRLLRFPPAHGGGGREIARPAAGLRLRRPAAPRRRLVRRDAAAGRHGARHRGGLARRDLPLDRHLGERLSRRRADRRGAPVRRLPDRDQPRAHPLLPAGAPLPARAGRGGPSRLDGGDPGMPATEYLIRELPLTERPRERLLEQGSGALSDVER